MILLLKILKREKAKLVLENKENAAKFLDPDEKKRKADYGKNIKGTTTHFFLGKFLGMFVTWQKHQQTLWNLLTNGFVPLAFSMNTNGFTCGKHDLACVC